MSLTWNESGPVVLEVRSRCRLVECNVKHTFLIFTASLAGASGLVALRSRKLIRSETPPSGFPAALLCFKPLIAIRFSPSLVSRTRPLPLTDLKLDLAPLDTGSSEPMLRRTDFCIAEGSIPVLGGCDLTPSGSCLRPCVEPRPAALPRPLPLPLPLLPEPAAPITRSPSLSTRTGVLFRFCIPPLLGSRLEVGRSEVRAEVRVARGPAGGVGACWSIFVDGDR